MNRHRMEITGLVIISCLISLSLTYYHFIFWGDIAAGYSNYFISIFVAPLVIAFLIGVISSFTFLSVRESPKRRAIVILAPPISTLVLALIVVAVLQWAPH